MNSTARSENESWLIGIPSSPAASGTAEIICREFSPARPIPLAHTVSLESLMQEFEGDITMAGHLSEARRNLANALYPGDESRTLASLRLNAGLSQAQLAVGAGTTQPYIARIERGQSDPSTEMVSRIARALGQSEEETFRAIRKQRAMHG